MPFYTLKDGSEVLIDKLDFPEPSESIFHKNPYLRTDPRFKKYLSASKARYYKSLYKATREAYDLEDFKNKIGDIHNFLRNTDISWNEYLRERGLPVEVKNSVGRPRLPDHLKKHNPRVKRSDLMKRLLAEKGISVSPEGKLFLDGNSVPYEGFLFQINGRIKHEESSTISTHTFIQEYC